MRILKIDFNNPGKEAIKKTAAIIRQGGIVVFPADTVYGLAADATNEGAVKKLFQIKKRNAGKQISVIVKDIKTARFYAAISKKTENILNGLFPGPYTAVLRKKEKLPEILTAETETIGLRIPKCAFTRLLAEELGVPYTATSANISGSPATGKIEEIKKVFSAGEFLPDLVIDAGDLAPSEESTIVDLTSEKLKVLRVGAAGKEKLFEILKKIDNGN